jgi:hypothetical protein
MDALAIVIAFAFTFSWGQRVPAMVVLVPIWVATGFLTPIVVLLPLTGLALGESSGPDLLEPWVQPMVYAGFGWQGILLAVAFTLYARTRWPMVFQAATASVPRGRTHVTQVVMGDVGAVLAVVAGVWLLSAGTWADGVLGLLALAAAAGVVTMAHRLPGRFVAPVAVTWLGAGSMFAWGMWGLVNTVGGTVLAGDPGWVPQSAVSALGGLLIGLASLLLLSGRGWASATAGRTARPSVVPGTPLPRR